MSVRMFIRTGKHEAFMNNIPSIFTGGGVEPHMDYKIERR
jgi:hypothetical protein